MLDMLLYLIFFTTHVIRRQESEQRPDIVICLCHFKIRKYSIDENVLTVDLLNQKRLTKNNARLIYLCLINFVDSLIRFIYFDIKCVHF